MDESDWYLAFAVVLVPLVAVVAIDPGGWFPFGPAKWAGVSVACLVAVTVAALTRRRGPARSLDRKSIGLAVLLAGLIVISAATGVGGRSAWVGDPVRHLGALSWILMFALFVVGPPAVLGDTTLGFTSVKNGPAFNTALADGSVQSTDVTNLFAEYTSLETGSAATTTEDRFVTAVRSWPDPIAEQGGVEVTKDGVTLRRANRNSPEVFLDTATGEPIPSSSIVYTNDGVVVDSGDRRFELSNQELEEFYNAVSVDPVDVGPWNIVTTADGVNFSVESIADLAGVDTADIYYVTRVASDGNQVVVTVSLNEKYPDETRKQIVLVGTPID
jgi:hypothetical protein